MWWVGKQSGTLLTSELPVNLAFGDADGKTLYLTARTGLYRIRLNVPAIRSQG
jgi:gluconolactonase